jgi:hypothetical protein
MKCYFFSSFFHFFHFFDLFDFAVKFQIIFLMTPAAQGIEAVSFFAAGKKDTSVKPGLAGPKVRHGRMRPNNNAQDP